MEYQDWTTVYAMQCYIFMNSYMRRKKLTGEPKCRSFSRTEYNHRTADFFCIYNKLEGAEVHRSHMKGPRGMSVLTKFEFNIFFLCSLSPATSR